MSDSTLAQLKALYERTRDHGETILSSESFGALLECAEALEAVRAWDVKRIYQNRASLPADVELDVNAALAKLGSIK